MYVYRWIARIPSMPRETRIPNRLERRPRHRRCRRYVCPLALQIASTTQTQSVIHITLITYTGSSEKCIIQ